MGEYRNVPTAGSQPPSRPQPTRSRARTPASTSAGTTVRRPRPSNPDHFLARWTGTLNLAEGTYQVKTTADDGIRVKVNGATMLDNWVHQGPCYYETFTVARRQPSLGHRMLRNTGTATALFVLTKIN